MTADSEPRGRRRFRRAGAEHEGPSELTEPLVALHAELLVLREENARLKAAQHQAADIGRLLDRTRSLRGASRHEGHDESAQLLVDGLVVRESLLEICREIERSMVAFEAKLDALAAAPIEVEAEPTGVDHVNGNGATDA